jgi:hypothetical protein
VSPGGILRELPGAEMSLQKLIVNCVLRRGDLLIGGLLVCRAQISMEESAQEELALQSLHKSGGGALITGLRVKSTKKEEDRSIDI